MIFKIILWKNSNLLKLKLWNLENADLSFLDEFVSEWINKESLLLELKRTLFVFSISNIVISPPRVLIDIMIKFFDNVYYNDFEVRCLVNKLDISKYVNNSIKSYDSFIMLYSKLFFDLPSKDLYQLSDSVKNDILTSYWDENWTSALNIIYWTNWPFILSTLLWNIVDKIVDKNIQSDLKELKTEKRSFTFSNRSVFLPWYSNMDTSENDNIELPDKINKPITSTNNNNTDSYSFEDDDIIQYFRNKN